MPRHQTLHKEIKGNILKLRNHHQVKKVVIGPYENCRHRYSPGAIVWQRDITSGFKLNGYDGSGIYTFYLYLKEEVYRQEVKDYLKVFKARSERN